MARSGFARGVPFPLEGRGPTVSHTAPRCIALITALLVTQVVAADPPASPGKGPVIRLNHKAGEEASASFDVVGLEAVDLTSLTKAKLTAAQWNALFGVYVEQPNVKDDKGPPVLGSYRVENDRLRFTPRFPLAPGVTPKQATTGGTVCKMNRPLA